MYDKRLLEELSDRAFRIYLENPDNEYARKVMLESNKMFLSVQEAKNKKEKSNEKSDEDSGEEQQNPEDTESSEEEDNGDESIQLFDDVEQSFMVDSVEAVDPLFGLKAGMAFDSVSAFQYAVIKGIAQDDQLDLLMGDNMYEQFDKFNKKKYKDVVRDYDKASTATVDGARVPLAFNLASNPEKQDFIISYVNSNTNKNRKVFIAHKDYGMEKYISYDLGESTVYNLGAGQLEFLARMVYLATGGKYPGISQKILVAGDRETAEAREQLLFKIAPGTVGYNCLRMLSQYLTKAAKRLLQPIIQKRHFHDFIPSGVDAVINGIRKGQYNFEEGNLARWAFQVIKNESIDLLKPITVYNKLDIDKSYDFISNQKKIQFYSKADPAQAMEMRKKIIETTGDQSASFSEVDTDNFITIDNVKFFLYKYDNMNSFFEDLKRANGYYKNAKEGYLEKTDSEGRKGAGAPSKYIYVSPVYFKNVRKEFKEKFMTTIAKSSLETPNIETSADVVQAKEELPREVKAREAAAERLSAAMVGKLESIVNDIYNKILDSPAKQNIYGQKNIVSFMRDNPRLTKKLMLGLLNFGIYKFQKNNWNWYTAPRSYMDEFLKDLEESDFTGQGMPSEIRNKDGNSRPIYDAGNKTGSFITILKKTLFGTGKLGRELSDLALAGDEESDERFKDLASKELSSVGFLLRNPSYIRDIYQTMQQMHSDAVVGRENIRAEKPYVYTAPTSDKELGIRNVNESIKNIKNFINAMKKEITNEKNNINSNFLKSWK